MKGFEEVTGDAAGNQAVAIIGPDGSGKSTLALSGPGPIALITNDLGEREAIKRARANGRRVFRKQLQTASDVSKGVEGSGGAKWVAFEVEQAQREMLIFRGLWQTALADRTIRSIAVDTATNVHELHRVAELGRLTHVESYHYGPINLEFKRLLERGIAENGCDKHVFFTHHVRKQYVKTGEKDSRGRAKSEWNGKWEMKGFEPVLGMVDLALWLDKDEDNSDAGLTARIIKCRHDRSLVGAAFPLFVDHEESGMFNYEMIYNTIFGKDPA